MGERMRLAVPTEPRSPRRPMWRILWRERRGAVALLIALALPTMIGFVGLGVETGLWYAVKGQNQSATDNAALSAAMELGNSPVCANYSKLATYAAQQDGFTPTSPATTFDSICLQGTTATPVSNCTSTTDASYICVNNPPTSGSQQGNIAAVEVILSQQLSTMLASLYLPSVRIQTRSVALSSNKACILALNSGNTPSSVSIEPDATVSIPTCWVAADSTSTTSIAATGTGTLCVYNISTAATSGPTTTTVANCTSPPQGIDVTHTPPLTSNGGLNGPTVTYVAPTVAAPFGTQKVVKSDTPSGSGPCTLASHPAQCLLDFPENAFNSAQKAALTGWQITDSTEPAGSRILAGTTVLGFYGDDVVMSNPAQDDGGGAPTVCPGSGSHGVCKDDKIVFTGSTSFQPNILYKAPVGLVAGPYTLSPGVYYIQGEETATTHRYKGVSLKGVALYVGAKATITSSGAVTIIVCGTTALSPSTECGGGDGIAHPAGAIDINCSFPFTSGSMALTAPSAAFTPSLGGSIPAGLLFYQDPSHADTTTANGSAICQTRGHNNVRNTITFGSGLTLSNDSLIYTPGAQFDFSGSTSSLCTILIADTITFGLNTAVTTNLTYPLSSCSHVVPPTVTSDSALAE